MSVYVQKNYGQPTAHLVRYALRTDGFSSLHGSYAGGEAVTRPLRFASSSGEVGDAGRQLVLNLSTSAAGGVRVEIQDEAGQPIPGFSLQDADELIGDEIERVATWRGKRDLAELAGRPIRLRFKLQDADLYSFRVR
jgi:hypothetical protein